MNCAAAQTEESATRRLSWANSYTPFQSGLALEFSFKIAILPPLESVGVEKEDAGCIESVPYDDTGNYRVR